MPTITIGPDRPMVIIATEPTLPTIGSSICMAPPPPPPPPLPPSDGAASITRCCCTPGAGVRRAGRCTIRLATKVFLRWTGPRLRGGTSYFLPTDVRDTVVVGEVTG
ncbi:hypothetical protein GCM10009743_21170 [Kribbella swartbergensis]